MLRGALRSQSFVSIVGTKVVDEAGCVLAKIAADLARAVRDGDLHGAAGTLRACIVAEASEWSTEDVLCTSGPDDPSYEERHTRFRTAIVAGGTFQCRSPHGRELLTPSSLLLGNAGDWFECGHEHGRGDRCLAFGYAQDYFERLAWDLGVRGAPPLRALRVPPVRELAPLVSHALAAFELEHAGAAWEELGVALAAQAIRLAGAAAARTPRAPPSAERAVSRAVRLIERDPGGALTLGELARAASLSPYHFLRTFARLTGLTPHQYVRRARLRSAAVRLARDDVRVLDVALECGFPDVSNFNRAFRTEFGVTPTAHRARRRAFAPPGAAALNSRGGGAKKKGARETHLARGNRGPLLWRTDGSSARIR